MDSNQNNQFRTGEDWPRNPHYDSAFPTAPESYPWNNVTGDYSHAFDCENPAPNFPNNSTTQLPVESHQENAAFPTLPPPTLFNSLGLNIDGNFALPSATLVVNDAPPPNGDLAQLQASMERRSKRRTRYNLADWDGHKPQIKKLYIEEDRSLEDTMKIMSEDFRFHPSSHVNWMKTKKDRRMLLEKKRTEFRVGETFWSAEKVEKSAKRAKLSENDSLGVETPAGIDYSTPFTVTFSPKMSKAPAAKWTPTDVASADVSRHNDNLYLVWNGHTKAEFEAMFRQAHELDRSGKVEDAEAKFREVLEDFEHVLSPTHDETNAVAYHLAEFLANQARMTEADTVLNWMGEKHFENWGMSHKKTAVHLLHVSDMYHSWSRSEDAISLLSRAMARYEKALKSNTENDNNEDSDASIVVELTRNTSSRNLRPRRSSTIIELNDDNPGDPWSVEYQLGLAMAQVKCEEHPKELAVQILDMRATLVEHYQRLGESEKTEKALQEAASSFWKVLKPDFKKTSSILEAAGKFAELHIEPEAVESFGEDGDSTVDILTAIGVFYQEQGRLDDAEPRFEQALSASMTAYGLDSEVTVRLETALKKKGYVLHCPNCEDFETKLRKRSTCRRVNPSPESRRRYFLTDPWHPYL
ncbi:Uncharacterized protein BP5553_02780 [Venustampulla echinocandica]|uniref:Clr5 domain-containing protein n=1 Tax=Venustampulla echinocandica TaxID=2656787 RepID=A0A370TSD6_9HELO|nr:Uncharacterized protein BP5553_02780 [Venustampulla echinocandica]RDL38440.1 Uncharacterized protein BP5553_02780 [Venustampulla echinocandica]